MDFKKMQSIVSPEEQNNKGTDLEGKVASLSLNPPKTEDAPTSSRSSSFSDSNSDFKFDTTNEEHLKKCKEFFVPVPMPKGKMAEKLSKAAPYNMFLTAVTDSPETHLDPLSVTFQELLDPSLGELEFSVLMTFLVNLQWLVSQYIYAGCSSQPLLVLYGMTSGNFEDIGEKHPNVTPLLVEIKTAIGCHHPKLMLLFYKDKSMRVVVSTSNLYRGDWLNRVQGVWISDRLPALDDAASDGESVTQFRGELLKLLNFYQLPELEAAIQRIAATDFSSVKVFLISSIPGMHAIPGDGNKYGHPRVAKLLKENSAPIESSVPIVLQASSIGFYGKYPNVYLKGEIASSFSRHAAYQPTEEVPDVKLIYPSMANVSESLGGINDGSCLSYELKTHENQRWLNKYLYQWRAASRNRTRALPHIKTYCRYDDKGLYWFILTSGNVSRSAWGSLNHHTHTLRINSYEAGIVFFPRVILGKDQFPMNENQRTDDSPVFKLPFDTPLVPYGYRDVPYSSDFVAESLLWRR